MKNRLNLSFEFVSQEMASSSSHNNNGIFLATQLEWYMIRDTFFWTESRFSEHLFGN
jgi:hypothetical protein